MKPVILTVFLLALACGSWSVKVESARLTVVNGLDDRDVFEICVYGDGDEERIYHINGRDDPLKPGESVEAVLPVGDYRAWVRIWGDDFAERDVPLWKDYTWVIE